jgi:hypothetical protein
MREGTSAIELSLPCAGLARLQQVTTKQIMRENACGQAVCWLYLLDCPAKGLFGFLVLPLSVVDNSAFSPNCLTSSLNPAYASL